MCGHGLSAVHRGIFSIQIYECDGVLEGWRSESTQYFTSDVDNTLFNGYVNFSHNFLIISKDVSWKELCNSVWITGKTENRSVGKFPVDYIQLITGTVSRQISQGKVRKNCLRFFHSFLKSLSVNLSNNFVTLQICLQVSRFGTPVLWYVILTLF